jgi:hypothetical protein
MAKTLRCFRQKCRVLVSIQGGKRQEAKLLFGAGMNDGPIMDRVYLDPHGWFNTDEVELIKVLIWKD